jgi:DnaA family protein
MMNTSLPRQFALDLSHTPPVSLDNFLPGKDLALVDALRQSIYRWQERVHSVDTNALDQRWIYWWGPQGSGRTHLLKAMGTAAADLGLEHFSLTPDEPITWVNLEERIPTLSQSIQSSVITVDDVDQLNDRQVAALFRILNKVQASQGIYIFMAGNAAPNHLHLREDLRTRLGWGLIFQTQLLNDDEKIQALETAARDRGLVLSAEVLPWLLNRFYRDMPNLMALLDALDAYSLETKRAVTLPLVRELLQSGQSTA